MENNSVRVAGVLKRSPRRYANPAYDEDRVSFSLLVPTIRRTGMSTCIVDVSAESEAVRDIALELREGDKVEVSGWLRGRSKKVNGHKDRQSIVEIIAERIVVLPDQGQQGISPRFPASDASPRVLAYSPGRG